MLNIRKILLISLAIGLLVGRAEACTNLIVGKKASADGSVMCTYNCDGFGFAGSLFYSPAGRHAAGENIAIRGWGPVHEGRYVEQVEYTLNVVGFMNEKQVTIVESTFDGRL
ncbi:MAG: C69 family dipeptidase, partial [Bacteroidales bacterium]|nr:C69 family dipeptidase [Bacteroidales bacterium]